MTETSDLVLAVEHDVTPERGALVLSVLDEANAEFGYPPVRQRYLATLRDSGGAVQGGISAQTTWGWLYIIALVVNAPWRRQGYGRRLLMLAEAWASTECS